MWRRLERQVTHGEQLLAVRGPEVRRVTEGLANFGPSAFRMAPAGQSAPHGEEDSRRLPPPQ